MALMWRRHLQLILYLEMRLFLLQAGLFMVMLFTLTGVRMRTWGQEFLQNIFYDSSLLFFFFNSPIWGDKILKLVHRIKGFLHPKGFCPFCKESIVKNLKTKGENLYLLRIHRFLTSACLFKVKVYLICFRCHVMILTTLWKGTMHPGIYANLISQQGKPSSPASSILLVQKRTQFW